MLETFFRPAIELMKKVSPLVKTVLLLLSGLLLVVGATFYTLHFGLSFTYYLPPLLISLLLWVYFCIAFILSLRLSILQVTGTLDKVAHGEYALRIEEVSAREFEQIVQAGNEMLASLEKNSAFLEEYKRVVDASSAVVKTDVEGYITYVNEAYEQLSGYRADELIGKSHALVRSERTSDSYLDMFWKKILNKEVFKGEFHNNNRDGKSFYVETTVVPILDERGEIFEFISIMFDITARKEQEKALEHQLYIDTLTSLPNRTALKRELQRDKEYKLILVNVDDFNTINTIYGEAVGDELVRQLAFKLREMLTSPNIKLFRHSGDEFAILANKKISETHFREDVILIAYQLNPVDLQCLAHSITVRARIGAAIGSSSGNFRSLTSMATLALRDAKKRRQDYVFYSESADNLLHLEEDMLTLEMLEYALKHGKVKVHFQPIANTKSDEIEKFEALVRIVDRNGEMHYPGEFMALAKGARLYSQITQAVVDQTFAMAERNPAYEFSFNIEIEDILNAETSRYILEKLRASHCAERIVLELVESQELEDNKQVYHFFKLIKAEGAKIAIDDFGSGYSNYAYLMKLGVDIVKIDGSLVSDITTNLNNKRIVKSIINITHELGMMVVTEFVENKDIYQTIVLLGADYAQGFFIEKAIGVDVNTLLHHDA